MSPSEKRWLCSSQTLEIIVGLSPWFLEQSLVQRGKSSLLFLRLHVYRKARSSSHLLERSACICSMIGLLIQHIYDSGKAWQDNKKWAHREQLSTSQGNPALRMRFAPILDFVEALPPQILIYCYGISSLRCCCVPLRVCSLPCIIAECSILLLSWRVQSTRLILYVSRDTQKPGWMAHVP